MGVHVGYSYSYGTIEWRMTRSGAMFSQDPFYRNQYKNSFV